MSKPQFHLTKEQALKELAARESFLGELTRDDRAKMWLLLMLNDPKFCLPLMQKGEIYQEVADISAEFREVEESFRSGYQENAWEFAMEAVSLRLPKHDRGRKDIEAQWAYLAELERASGKKGLCRQRREEIAEIPENTIRSSQRQPLLT